MIRIVAPPTGKRLVIGKLTSDTAAVTTFAGSPPGATVQGVTIIAEGSSYLNGFAPGLETTTANPNAPVPPTGNTNHTFRPAQTVTGIRAASFILASTDLKPRHPPAAAASQPWRHRHPQDFNFMNQRTFLALGLILSGLAQAEDLSKPIAPRDLVFEEQAGIVAIEAEHFVDQSKSGKRAWYLTTKDKTPDVLPDGDPSHIGGASGGAYLEVLPDTRRTHSDKLIKGENFTDEPGVMSILTYRVHFNTPGKYWIWARAFSTTTEDNGLHFGINGNWPDSAKKWQTVIKNQWHWKSAQRTDKVHVGVPGILTLEVPEAGVHEIHVSMREDGIALDRILLVNRKDYTPEGMGPQAVVKSGAAPDAFEMVAESKAPPSPKPAADGGKKRNAPSQVPGRPANELAILPADLTLDESGYYLDKGKWLAIDPEVHKTARISTASAFPSGTYDLTLEAVGESDGSSTYEVRVNDASVGKHTCPMSAGQFDEGPRFHATFKRVKVASGDVIDISSQVASADGKEWSRARWVALVFTPADPATKAAVASFRRPEKSAANAAVKSPDLQQPRQPDGDGAVRVSGELKQWHKVTLTLNGPHAHELDNKPNPFTDHSFWVTFTHESGRPSYTVPGYFAADGDAANSSAVSGNQWRAHLSPDLAGTWNYSVAFLTGDGAAFSAASSGKPFAVAHGGKGSFTIAATDKQAPDFRARGRLAYVGKHHLQFQGDHSYFLKAGADAPETLLGFADFDDTKALDPKKVPLKTFKAHVSDWQAGDPIWKDGKGKGLIGALNYLAGKGMNAFSFLPYNVDGDGSNVWPFVAPRDKMHYDCSKLGQWGIVFDHATNKGLYLHFKLQENEIDDNRRGQGEEGGSVPASLDGGRLGPERKLYCRELVARFGHALALNWNIGEESTQSTGEIKDMIGYLRDIDPYDHHVVLHTYPNQQDKQYRPLLGFNGLTGLSLQNEWNKVHELTVKWARESAGAGHPWVCANDEQGGAGLGVPPDPGFPGNTRSKHGVDDIRKLTLWGNLMAGGAGVEYYFGYQLAENDLVAENWRSRDQSWEWAAVALGFFREQAIPFQEMTNRNELVGNISNDNSRYCFAKDGEVYLVYLPEGGSTDIKLPSGPFTIAWLNTRTGEMSKASPLSGTGLTAPDRQDWLAVIRRA